MSKKALAIIIVVLLLVALVSCGGANKTKTDSSEKIQTKSEEKAEEREEENTEVVEETDENKIDTSLTGTALLQQLNYDSSGPMIMKTMVEITDGMDSMSMTYMKDENRRVETITDAGNSILIYNAADKMTYIYSEDESFGMKVSDEMNTDMMIEEGMDMSIPTLDAYIQNFDDDYIASVQTLDGKDVIYIETKDNSDGQAYTVHMWYSLEYAVPLKHEVLSDGKLVLRSVVTEFESDAKIEEEIFSPPSNIEFMDISDLGGMMGDAN